MPEIRIVSDKLWQRVKERQKEIGELFDFGQSNRLNATHRPGYLLSHLLECAECGGPYAISGKDRYSCTNRKKRLPVDELRGGLAAATARPLRVRNWSSAFSIACRLRSSPWGCSTPCRQK
ncbi:zinc ribbon domain-containing protein [Rhizobiaceae bacterium n13]|uniref:Zinc ribbon domain-containing protein n=1 Tax=Ferirhizobium litorale TaxID=2927786 RepID=A0AAE3Q796_9HYPH|nr:zinc ribbon domain-containing protein [Fererhizobium litorale]MDI7860327.1 zinc ribbon domain-containing protein [Fererhizobium litorale]MDI7920462.1 zinc ribbon domain-containing protein [Fererhizobium litorale]